MDKEIEQGAHGGKDIVGVTNDVENLDSSILDSPEELEFEKNNPPRSTSINNLPKPESIVPQQTESKASGSERRYSRREFSTRRRRHI